MARVVGGEISKRSLDFARDDGEIQSRDVARGALRMLAGGSYQTGTARAFVIWAERL